MTFIRHGTIIFILYRHEFIRQGAVFTSNVLFYFVSAVISITRGSFYLERTILFCISCNFYHKVIPPSSRFTVVQLRWHYCIICLGSLPPRFFSFNTMPLFAFCSLMCLCFLFSIFSLAFSIFSLAFSIFSLYFTPFSLYFFKKV